MLYLIIFVASCLFVYFVVPVVQSLAELITTWIACKTSYWSLDLQDYSNQINGGEDQGANTQCIGFQIPDEIEYYEEEDKCKRGVKK